MSILERLSLVVFALLVGGPLLHYYWSQPENQAPKPEPQASQIESIAHRRVEFVDLVQRMPVCVMKDDLEMRKAIRAARISVDSFVDMLNSPAGDQHGFNVRARITEKKSCRGEVHVWLDPPVRLEGEFFMGTVGCSTGISGADCGDLLAVPKYQITDWMFIENGKLVGGFTYRVARSRLSAKARCQLDREAGFCVGK